MTRTTPKLLYSDLGRHRQNVTARQVYDVESITHQARGLRLRLTVTSNPYQDQCEAVAELFDGTRWHRLCDILSGEMQTETGLYITGPQGMVTFADFDTDLTELLRRALLVIDGKTRTAAEDAESTNGPHPYLVRWEIEVEADSPYHAAERARDALADRDKPARRFDVYGEGGHPLIDTVTLHGGTR